MSKYLLSLFFLTFTCQVMAQDRTKFCDQLAALSDLVEQEHFAPKTLDDSLSINVYNLFISQIDDDNRLFLQKDLNHFSQDEFLLDDFIANGNCDFINKYIITLNKRIEDTKTVISNFSKIDFDYSGVDTLKFKGREAFRNLKDLKDVDRYWNKRIRYDILYTMIENDTVFKSLSENFKAQEEKLKSKIISQELCKLEELQNKKGNLSQFVEESFLNAYLLYHDPNSLFFNASDKNVYENQLSNNQYSFGIVTAKNDNGDVVIAHIVPGGAAFKNGDIEENDIITALISEEKTLEAYCVSNADILAFVNDDNINNLIFRIKKPGGIIKDIALAKEETKTEENTITGYILNTGHKVGYINISSFYTDFESPNGLGVANDVAKELYKLQKEHIKGLIIDLRFNGGGSMKEAADLSGMFINRGPLSILKYNNGDTFIIKDTNRGTLFTKPIVVLVNNFSASASEFFSAAMQDYGRAIIVGSTTHGKASAQVILPLNEKKDAGFTKLTVEKFYRITGKSHQSFGVVPDISLPNIYDGFETEEQFNKFALPNDMTPPARGVVKLESVDITELQEKSSLRIAKNDGFQAVKSLNKIIINNYFNRYTQYTLTLENVYNEMQTYHRQWLKLDDSISNQVTNVNAVNTTSTQNMLSLDTDQYQINEAILKDINNDIYIKEANTILFDILEQLDNPD